MLSDILPPARPHPSRTTSWRPCIQTPEAMGSILFKTPELKHFGDHKLDTVLGYLPSALELDQILPVIVNKRKERSNTKMNAHNIFIIPYIGLI